MKALKRRMKVKNRKIVIDLPDDFEGDEVEVIVKPLNKKKPNKEKLLELLLNAPTFNDAELAEFENVRKWLNEWKVQSF